MIITNYIDTPWLQRAAMKEELTVSTAQIQMAIGRLIVYGIISNWDSVTISPDGSSDLLAVYRKDMRSFTMGAVWRPEDGIYTFHS